MPGIKLRWSGLHVKLNHLVGPPGLFRILTHGSFELVGEICLLKQALLLFVLTTKIVVPGEQVVVISSFKTLVESGPSGAQQSI